MLPCVKDEVIHSILVDNSRRFLAFCTQGLKTISFGSVRTRLRAVTRSVSLAIVAVLAASAPARAQQQTPATRTAWPCGGRLDPSYFRVAEGTGGQLFLLAPDEIADSTPLLTAFNNHPQTIFRLAGTVTAGLRDFQIPIDPSVESVVFSASVQCLDAAYVLQPSGELASGDGVTDVSGFRAQRLVIVKRPQPGIWTVRVAGRGVAGVIVQARSPVGITNLEFAPAQSTTFTALPTFGVENALRMQITGQLAQFRASLVSGINVPLGTLPVSAGDTEASYVSRFTPTSEGFRVMIVGKDAEGFTVQRMYAPLFTPLR
jgi:hypothetical protein